MIIALTGFMGCGKSSVGRELSTLLGLPVIDLDQFIVRKAGRSIADIFAVDGESFFRDLETEALSDLLCSGGSPSETSCSAGPLPSDDGPLPLTMPRVARFPRGNCRNKQGTVFEGTLPQQNHSQDSFILSLGGGTIIRPENVAILKEHCKVFFLRADVETLKLHLQGEQSQRPLLRSGGFEALLLERTPLYTAAADYIIDTDSLSPMQIAGVIANLVT
jgi:shikimate kinase